MINSVREEAITASEICKAITSDNDDMNEFIAVSCSVSILGPRPPRGMLDLSPFPRALQFSPPSHVCSTKCPLPLSLHLGLFLGAKKGDSSVEIFVGRPAQNKWTIIMDSFGFPPPPVVHYGCCPFDFSTGKRVHFRIGNREGQK